MKKSLHPEALKAARNKKGWTQKQLSEKSRCSVEQISRWERGESLNVRSNSSEKLIKALGVSWEELTSAPAVTGNEEFKLFPTIQLNIRVHPRVRTALILASHRYHVHPKDIIELAPLLFLITAEKSLNARQVNVSTFTEQIDQALHNGQEMMSHLAPAFQSRWELDEALYREQCSINQREVFNKVDLSDLDLYFGNDWKQTDPYVSYLGHLIEDLPDGLVEYISPSYSRAPNYRIAGETLKEVTGIAGETEKERELLKFIFNGDINLSELIKEKQKLSKDEYKDWLARKYTEAEAEQKAAWDELFEGLPKLSRNNGGDE